VDAIKEQSDAYFSGLKNGATADANDAGVKLNVAVIAGHEVGAIVEYIRRGRFDLLIIGFHGHSAIYARVVGTTAQGLMSHAPCSVLVVK